MSLGIREGKECAAEASSMTVDFPRDQLQQDLSAGHEAKSNGAQSALEQHVPAVRSGVRTAVEEVQECLDHFGLLICEDISAAWTKESVREDVSRIDAWTLATRVYGHILHREQCIHRAASLLLEKDGRPMPRIIGDKIHVSHHLGGGGFADVFRGVHRDGTVVAAKVYRQRQSGGTDTGLQRFRRERRINQRLDKVIAQGESPEYAYFAVPFIPGRSLDKITAAVLPRRFHPQVINDLAFLIALKMEPAHAEGIWHRDLKPGNIYIGDDGEVKILDYGLAHIDGGEEDEDLTTSRNILGSQPYMSPEQINSPTKINEATDLYSLGCVLYELETGVQPFADRQEPAWKCHGSPEIQLDCSKIRDPELRRIVAELVEKEKTTRRGTMKGRARQFYELSSYAKDTSYTGEPLDFANYYKLLRAGTLPPPKLRIQQPQPPDESAPAELRRQWTDRSASPSMFENGKEMYRAILQGYGVDLKEEEMRGSGNMTIDLTGVPLSVDDDTERHISIAASQSIPATQMETRSKVGKWIGGAAAVAALLAIGAGTTYLVVTSGKDKNLSVDTRPADTGAALPPPPKKGNDVPIKPLERPEGVEREVRAGPLAIHYGPDGRTQRIIVHEGTPSVVGINAAGGLPLANAEGVPVGDLVFLTPQELAQLLRLPPNEKVSKKGLYGIHLSADGTSSVHIASACSFVITQDGSIKVFTNYESLRTMCEQQGIPAAPEAVYFSDPAVVALHKKLTQVRIHPRPAQEKFSLGWQTYSLEDWQSTISAQIALTRRLTEGGKP